MKASILLRKTTASLSVMTLLAFGAQSCRKAADELQAPAVDKNAQHIEELKQFVASSTGMNASAVEYSAADKQFILEGDMTFDQADIEKRFAEEQGRTGQTEQRRYTYVVSRAKASNITIYADPTVPADWVAILDKAISNWNNSGSLLYLRRVTTSTANIKVSANYMVSNIIAQAMLPSSYGDPGKTITINTYKNSISIDRKIFAITHELGHSFGFTHTDGTYGSIITGTPTTDASSIMNSIALAWTAFTNNDLIAIRTVYPK